MSNISFGRRQIGRPTPASFEFWAKIWIGVTGLFFAWIPTNNIIPHGVQDIITPVGNLINSIVIFLLPFFGVSVQEGTTKIPIEDVKVMEEKKAE